MKLKKVLGIALATTVLLGVTACSSSEPAKTGNSDAAGGDVNGDGEIIIGYIAKNTTDPQPSTINSSASEQLDKLKADGVIDDWTGIMDGLSDANKQVDLAQDCIAQGCDYVIITPAEAVASDPAITNLVDAGVKVVVVNAKTDSTDDVAMTFCGSDDVYAGELMAEYLNEKLPDGGKYLHCQGVIGNSAQIQRAEGITNKLNDNFECIAEVPCEWSGEKAVNATHDALAQYGKDLTAVICDNDDMSAAAQLTCNESGREDIICIGVDGNAGAMGMIQEGTLDATVLQDSIGQITAAIDAIVADINGETVEKEYLVPFVIVTAENVDEYATE
ncbi:substrate-binding domain-containing protein [Mediterraneibacter sp. NSJ-55]|uniref:Substrate-binding domain-containing protein n=1 Tax=Mediterraneibacter hominis TaxID=2763054 RepID=A0A923LHZ0_9FIRM|nr:substrate-binding domain-containing protein [Mediterraneibacter hominis]MBC5689006.1 substrate-binding domain-containing protein [Mediterraneibacter hominis]